ncbi:AbiH family protein, partial [Vibrio parahaemolyticus]
MPDTLYIIGNGFDLHHGMQTSYESFKLYLQRKHQFVFDTVEKF